MQDKAQPEDTLIARTEGAIARVIFNNPAKHNAVSLEMWERLDSLLAGFADDAGIRVLVIAGAGGKAFVSGADISKFESERATRAAADAYNEAAQAAYARLYHFPKPTIAGIEGYCIGGGVNLAVCCDLRYCTEGSQFGIPAAKLGLGYGHAGLKKLIDVVGPARAMEMFYTARRFTAAEAYEMGLVNAVVGDGELDAHIDDVTGRIGENAPLTIAAIKAASRALADNPENRDLAKLDEMVQACFDSEDYVEGRSAFMEKRKPQFKGK